MDMEVKWTTKFEVEKAETEDQLSRRVEVARKKYIVESRADMIEELSEKIYNATEMPPRPVQSRSLSKNSTFFRLHKSA